ncbi:MAG: MFS transporter [Beijerinckiaceae bacterium]|nr:MFS transporter [Beijerinckiaceae bacterium]
MTSPSSDPSGQADAPSPRTLFFSVFPSIMIPMFLAIVDQTIVSTALPNIASELGDVERVSWVVVAYLISTTIAAPVYGYLGDTFGRRKLMFVALSLFLGSSLLCALAPSVLFLSFARVLQGLGGGGLITLSQALIGEVVPPRERGNFQGYLATVAVTSAAFGPVAGGWITEHLGWRMVFVVNAPLCLLAFVLVARLKKAPGLDRKGWRFDTLGLVYFIGFILPLLLSLEQAQKFDARAGMIIAALLAFSLLCLVLLIRQEKREAAPLLSLYLLRKSAIWQANALAACHGAALTALVAFVPIYLRVVRGASPTETGYLLLPITAGIGIGAIVTGRLVSRTGMTMYFPSVGLVFASLTLFGFAFAAPLMTMGQISLLLTINSLFMGTVMGVVQVTTQTAAGPKMLGASAAAVQFSRSIGAALGTAILGALLFASLRNADPEAAAIFGKLVEDGPAGFAGLEPARVSAMQNAIASAFRLAFLALGAFTTMGMLLAWANPMRRV